METQKYFTVTTDKNGNGIAMTVYDSLPLKLNNNEHLATASDIANYYDCLKWTGMGWVVSQQRMLENAKNTTLLNISNSIAKALSSGFMTSLGFRMDATMDALQRLKAGYDFSKLVGNTKMSVVDYTNAVHADMTLADVEIILKEVGANYQALYLLKQQLRSRVMAATTLEAVNAVAWPSG